jgi:hypothetical protein
MSLIKDNWGNQELPGITNEELFSDDFARRIRYAENGEILKLLFQDPTFKERHQKAINKAMAERADSPEFAVIVEKIRLSNIEYRKLNPYTEEEKKRIGDTMRGKTLEEMLGKERATAGRKARSISMKVQHESGARSGVGKKSAATRKANGSYEGSGMTGHTHKESTKVIQGQKAKIRQELKRKLGLGKSDSVPNELLEVEYKKQGLL